MNIKLPLLNAIRCEHAGRLICQLQACWSQFEGEDCQKEREKEKKKKKQMKIELGRQCQSQSSAVQNRIYQSFRKGLWEEIQTNFTAFDPRLIPNRCL